MSMQPVPWPESDPQIAAAIKAMYGSRKTERPLAVEVRDRLGQWLADEDFAAAFGDRGRSPRFRQIWRTCTVIWGTAILADAVVRALMAAVLPVSVVPALGAALWPVTFVVLQVVTNVYFARAGFWRILIAG